MTAQEHYELSQQYREQAMEQLRLAGSHEFAFEGAGEYEEYKRLSRLANKHYGIWRMVQTQRRNRAERRRRQELDAWLATA